MKLLYVDTFSSYPLARAGGHRSGHGLLRRLARQDGFECMAVMPKRGRGAQFPSYDPKVSDFETLGIRQLRLEAGRWHFDCGYPIWAVERVAEALPEAFDLFRPDLVYCQSPESLPVLTEARQRGLAALWYLRDTRPTAEDLRAATEQEVQLVAVSKFIAHRALEVGGVEAEVVYSVVEEEAYRVKPEPAGAVTLINPVPLKGFEMFPRLAAQLPEVPFLVVEAWPLGPELENVQAQLAAFPNVRFLRQRSDVREVYRQTRLLLVPSIVAEGGPRVIREAQLSGIPVLGSSRGAIPEFLGDGGLVIEDDENPRAWASAIAALWNDPDHLNRLARAARSNARREEFDADGIVRRFLAVCRQAQKRIS